MLVSTLVNNVKRRCQVSDVNTTNDQPTTDIINFLANRMYQFWRAHSWHWLLVPISIQTVIGQTDYSIISTTDTPGQRGSVGDIVALTVGVQGKLKSRTLQYYYDRLLNNQIDPTSGLATVPANGTITDYVKIGRDANDNMLLRFWRPPDVAAIVTGFGKKRIVKPILADIAAGNPINYFPDEVCDILELGVEADIYDTINKDELFKALDSQFKNEIGLLKADEGTGEDDDQLTPPPISFVWKHRKRGGTTVV